MTLYLGHDGCWNLPGEERLEVETGEPLVRLDVLRAPLHAAESLGEVGHEELLDQALGVLVHEPREGELARKDQLVDLFVFRSVCMRSKQVTRTQAKASSNAVHIQSLPTGGM